MIIVFFVCNLLYCGLCQKQHYLYNMKPNITLQLYTVFSTSVPSSMTVLQVLQCSTMLVHVDFIAITNTLGWRKNFTSYSKYTEADHDPGSGGEGTRGKPAVLLVSVCQEVLAANRRAQRLISLGVCQPRALLQPKVVFGVF